MQNFLKSVSDDDLENVIRHNIHVSYQMRKELETMSQLQETPLTCSHLSAMESFENSQVDTVDEEQIEEYVYYYANLLENLKLAVTKEEQLEVIKQNLPVKENKNYMNIIYRIKLELYKEIYDFEVLKQDEIELEFIEEVNQEILSIQNLIHMIDEVVCYEEHDIVSFTPTKNKLIFLTTHNGSIYAENDLYSIPKEYYPSFHELLLSIENGTFKNVKFLSRTHNVINGISEVKDFKTRVIFERLAKDIYIILDIFVKKVNSDNGYLQSLENRISYYKNIKPNILNQLTDENYLLVQEEIKNRLMQSLEEKNIVKTIKKKIR